MRNDTANKPTGGLRRLYDLHALVPKLGLFAEKPEEVPYDYDDLLAAIAPRPTLLYTPKSDRDATYSDVLECVNSVSSHWPQGRLNHTAPESITKMEASETDALSAWLKAVST